jgi:hypothetical protein
MEIIFYLKADREENLYCCISDRKHRRTFSMEYTVNEKFWDSEKGEVRNNDPYFYTLQDFKLYLLRRSFGLETERKGNVLDVLKEEALDLLKSSGMEGVTKNIFNICSDKFGLPKYDGYLQAFEKYTGLKNNDYRVEILDTLLHFHTDKETYEMDTYEGKTAELKDIIKSRSYLDITTLTDNGKWRKIYDDEIPKDEFLPVMRRELEYCLEENFIKTGIFMEKNEYVEEIKKRSWEQFEIFSKRCEQANIIDLAMEIDEDILYPVAVITMANIFNLDACCLEYCELEFYKGEDWKAIFMDDKFEEEDDNLPVFYSRSV